MQHTEYSGKETLEYLEDAVKYNAFLERQLVQSIAAATHVVDFGAGNGECAKRLRKKGITPVLIEADSRLRATLSQQGFMVLDDIADVHSCDYIYSLNVLEHIEDDRAALVQLHTALRTGGTLFLYVPAFACLYTEFDRAIGHFRRYRKKGLIRILEQAGFQVERAEYVDSLGFLCWWMMGKLPGNKTRLHPVMIKIYDRLFFPISRFIDNVSKDYVGKNLLVIARK